MMLYVNGDSHAAAAEAVNVHAFAEDDPALFYLGRAPHPENLAVSWGKQLSLTLRAGLRCDAESASSNARILRTTRAWLSQVGSDHPDPLVIIQWSTWEREEWLHNGVYYQVGSSGIDHVPQELQEKYRNYVIGTDWKLKTEQAHKEIWTFHQQLTKQGIKHIFFKATMISAVLPNAKNGVSTTLALTTLPKPMMLSYALRALTQSCPIRGILDETVMRCSLALY
jgi:hypothetical protein